jgi:hypothetical protein
MLFSSLLECKTIFKLYKYIPHTSCHLLPLILSHTTSNTMPYLHWKSFSTKNVQFWKHTLFGTLSLTPSAHNFFDSLAMLLLFESHVLFTLWPAGLHSPSSPSIFEPVSHSNALENLTFVATSGRWYFFNDRTSLWHLTLGYSTFLRQLALDKNTKFRLHKTPTATLIYFTWAYFLNLHMHIGTKVLKPNLIDYACTI